jgi:hypothetical protein
MASEPALSPLAQLALRYVACTQYFVVTTPWLDLGLDLCPPSLEQLSLSPLCLCQHSGTIPSLRQCSDVPALRACLPWLPTLCMHAAAALLMDCSLCICFNSLFLVVYGLIRTLTATVLCRYRTLCSSVTTRNKTEHRCTARGASVTGLDIAVLVHVLRRCFSRVALCLTKCLVYRAAATREGTTKAHALKLPVDALHK